MLPMSRLVPTALLFFTCTVTALHAQTKGEENEGPLRRWGEDARAYVTAPLHAHREQWVKFAGTVGAIAFAYQHDDDVRVHFVPAGTPPPATNETHGIEDALPSVLALGGTWLAARAADNRDGRRVAVWGGSFGGYWAAKLAYVEAARLKGAVFHGSNVHHGFQESWLRPALTERASAAIFGPVGLFQARSKAMGVASLEEFLKLAPSLSLKQQGLLDQPSAPILCVNGKLDDQAPVEDIYLLMEHGSPKEARIYPHGGHMGRGGGVRDEQIAEMITAWLKLRLSQ